MVTCAQTRLHSMGVDTEAQEGSETRSRSHSQEEELGALASPLQPRPQASFSRSTNTQARLFWELGMHVNKTGTFSTRVQVSRDTSSIVNLLGTSAEGMWGGGPGCALGGTRDQGQAREAAWRREPCGLVAGALGA